MLVEIEGDYDFNRQETAGSNRRSHAPIAAASVFRHTVASRMLRQGARLKEIADFLGHRDLQTTTIYAKLDLPSLLDVALPYPELAP